jgi:hypothetical protein
MDDVTITELGVELRSYFIIIFTEKGVEQLDRNIRSRKLIQQIERTIDLLLEGKIHTFYVSKHEEITNSLRVHNKTGTTVPKPVPDHPFSSTIS